MAAIGDRDLPELAAIGLERDAPVQDAGLPVDASNIFEGEPAPELRQLGLSPGARPASLEEREVRVLAERSRCSQRYYPLQSCSARSGEGVRVCRPRPLVASLNSAISGVLAMEDYHGGESVIWLTGTRPRGFRGCRSIRTRFDRLLGLQLHARLIGSDR